MGLGSHELPNQTLWIRVYCIITAFSVDEDRISAGESDLRLIGEVLRLFHETPVLAPIDVGGEVMQAQMVLQPLRSEERRVGKGCSGRWSQCRDEKKGER